jgi:hypothetical protein
MKIIKRLSWTVVAIAPIFIYLELVWGVNLDTTPWYEVIGFGACIGFSAAIENTFNKDTNLHNAEGKV